MQCKDCGHWQGHKYSEWGDCYCIISKLEPNLSACYLTNDYGTVEKFFDVPFDPHDAKYWNMNPYWKALYKQAYSNLTKLGIRVKEEVRDDIVYDDNGGERLGRLKLHYFQTHKDFTCDEE